MGLALGFKFHPNTTNYSLFAKKDNKSEEIYREYRGRHKDYASGNIDIDFCLGFGRNIRS